MSKPVHLDTDAEAELAAAEAWYDEQAGLGSELAAAVRDAGDRVSQRPGSFPFAPRLPRKLGVRRCLVQRFPYALYFMELPDKLLVIAVAHHRRRPLFWRQRVRGWARRRS